MRTLRVQRAGEALVLMETAYKHCLRFSGNGFPLHRNPLETKETTPGVPGRETTGNLERQARGAVQGQRWLQTCDAMQPPVLPLMPVAHFLMDERLRALHRTDTSMGLFWCPFCCHPPRKAHSMWEWCCCRRVNTLCTPQTSSGGWIRCAASCRTNRASLIPLRYCLPRRCAQRRSPWTPTSHRNHLRLWWRSTP